MISGMLPSRNERMATNHVDMIRKLALENSRLHDALKKAEKLYASTTGESLCKLLGVQDLLMPDVIEPARITRT